MRALCLVTTILFSLQIFAATSKTEITSPNDLGTPYTMEPSITSSSINGGTQFLSVALTTRLFSWFKIGVEGDLPLSFNDRGQIYQGRGFTRFNLLSSTNEVYLQTALMLGLFSRRIIGTQGFAGVEALVGYSRKIANDWRIGGRVGIQAAGFNYDKEIETFDAGYATINNRFTFYASYLF